MVRRLFLSLALFVVSLATGSAQAIPTVISQHYTTDEGLPSNNVLCALKDRDGFLWFGTWYGLCRFDGDKFVTYNQPVRPDSDLPPNKVESIAEDAQGRLWLKTVDWKLYVFDRQKEHFHNVYDELKRHTRNLQVIKIQRTDEGRILLLTKDKTLLLAYTDPKGHISITTLFDAKELVDPQTLQLQQDVQAEANGYTFYIGRDYRLFIHRSKKTQRAAAFADMMAKAEASQQRQTEQLTAMAHEAGIEKYVQLYQDRDSLLWVTTTADGIYCISRPPSQFNLMSLPDDDMTGVRCIYQTRKGYILVGSRSRNLYVYQQDGTLLQTLDYKIYGIGAVYHATEDKRGRLWLSTKGDGLVVGTLGSLTHYRHDPADPTSISGNNVYMTYIDSKGHVWVGTLDGGLNLVKEEADGRLTFYHKGNGFTHYPTYGKYTEVRNITEDQQGYIWVGTIDGLMSFRSEFIRPQNIMFHTSHDTKKATFANNDIYAMHRDQNGQLWVGAFGGGLQKLIIGEDHLHPTFQPLGLREGLRSDVIYSITEDLHGHLWLATEKGLACYNQQTGRIRNFDRYDGLPDVKMEEASATCCSDGKLWIGCKQGILTFTPEQLQTSDVDYRTFITELTYDNQPYLGATALPYTDHIELDYNQNAFSIEFAALNYQNHGNVNYRYQLEGFDRDWRYSGIHRIASYNEVPPGRYTFVVETIDNANPALHSSAQLTIRILPPWWATWWAYLIYICLASLIAWLVIRTILQMNRMRNEIYISQRLAKLTSKPNDGDEFIDRVHRIIRENIANSDFNIDAIATEMGLSRSAFYKKVKGQTGFAPVDLIKEFRLSYAAELLQTTTLSITEVAYRSGFKDPSYFGKCFRKRYGMTAREYIKNES
jgi:ligand-binding sensor domain-containing protein/AraC-like DNA-binding protein